MTVAENVRVSIQVWTPSVLAITLMGHPTHCMIGAREAGKAYFRGPWCFTEIEARHVGLRDDGWEFRVRMEHK